MKTFSSDDLLFFLDVKAFAFSAATLSSTRLKRSMNLTQVGLIEEFDGRLVLTDKGRLVATELINHFNELINA